MKKQLWLIAICMAAFIVCRAQTKPETTKSLLWRISGKNIKTPSYLFGTCHIICTPDYIWTDKMADAMQGCNELCLEMDIDDQGEMQKIMAGMALPAGKKLSDYFTPARYELLGKFLADSIHIPMAMFAGLKPTALLGVLENYAANCGAAASSYEMNLVKLAKESKKDINGFETADEMLVLLDKIPEDSIVAGVYAMCTDFKANKEYTKTIIQHYKDQDITAIYNHIHSSGALGKNEAFLIDERNKRWITSMENKMPLNPVFFAVGAGHLGGPNGLIAQLRQKGYTVEPVQ
jgi:uncharacterized protein